MIKEYYPLWKLAQTRKQKIAVENGVAIRNIPWFETNDVRPMQKRKLWEATKKYLQTPNRVVFVGGGKGVVPIKTAQYGCEVAVYEAAEEMVDQLEDTATLNRQKLEIHHALVDAGYDIFGDGSNAEHVDSDDLVGDVLVLDCEGAEADILPAEQFDVVVVETHPQLGASTSDIKEQLSGDVEHFATTRHKGDLLIRT